MKASFIIIIFIAFCMNSLNAQTYSQHSMFQTPEGMQELVLELDGNVKVVATKSSRISVETTIDTNLPNAVLLKVLADAGRYDLTMEEDLTFSQLHLKSNQRKNVLIVKGKECEEIISYVIHVPENMQVVTKSMLAADE